jgi:hypothetical protein
MKKDTIKLQVIIRMAVSSILLPWYGRGLSRLPLFKSVDYSVFQFIHNWVKIPYDYSHGQECLR